MTSKEYLSQIYRIDCHINSMLLELKDLEDKLDSLGGAPGERVQTSAKNDAAFVNGVLKVADFKRSIEKEIDNLIEKKREIGAAIEKVSSTDEKIVLRFRYVNCLSWESIAEQMNYSLRQIYNIHNRALMNFEIPKTLH